MRITTSNKYAYGRDHDCDIRDCQAHYCNNHRVLWQDCDTSETDYEGSGRPLIILKEAPCCLAELRRNKMGVAQ